MGAITPLLADVQDLADWIGEPIPAGTLEHTRAERVIRYASILVQDEAGTSFVSETWQSSVPEKAVSVTLQVAARGYLNPESWGNERTDDWGGGGRPVEELGMYLTATEKALLSEFRPAKPKGIGIMRLERPGAEVPYHGYVTTPDGPPIPWY